MPQVTTKKTENQHRSLKQQKTAFDRGVSIICLPFPPQKKPMMTYSLLVQVTDWGALLLSLAPVAVHPGPFSIGPVIHGLVPDGHSGSS